MPKIIIEADRDPDGDAAVSDRADAHVTLSERVVTDNLESSHYASQLLERVAWATADAEAIENRAQGQGQGSKARARRRTLAQVVMSAVITLVVGALALTPTASARGNHGRRGPAARSADAADQVVALQWYDITNQTIAAAAYPEPVTQSRAWSVSWLAAARAVRPGGNPNYAVAAFAQALHDTLAAQVPSQSSQLDADLASTLAEIPDGWAKRAGIAAGQWQAAEVLAARHGDGLDTASVDTPFATPPAAPGVWQPTPPTYAPAIRAGEGNGRPFILASADQFDPGPPPSLTSPTYLAGLAEVRGFGSATSAVRTPQETDVALFWEPAINVQYVQLLREVLADTQQPLAWDARFVAAFNVITTDAQIGIYNAKFKYLFWRPVTAIRTSAVDPEPSWTPLFTTPRHPDWPSGHGGVAGAAQQVLTAFLGPSAPAPISLTSPTDPGSTHTFERWSQITREVIDARVWEGIHFRFSDIAGARLGSRVARYDLRHLQSIGL